MTEASRLTHCSGVPALICRQPLLIVTAVFALFVLAVLQIYDPVNNEVKLLVDPSEQALLGTENEGWEFYQSSRRMFGNDETVMVSIDADNVFSPDTIDLVIRLTTGLAEVEGVEKVVSVTNALTIRSTDFGIDIAPVMEKRPESAEEYQALRKEVLSNPLIAESLVSKDNTTTAILLNLDSSLDQAAVKRVNDAIDAIVAAEAQGGHRVLATGAPRIKLATTENVLSDLVTFPPLITAVMMVLLWLMMRNVSGVLVPLTAVLISVTCTMATIVQLGYSLNIITALVPPLLMIITLSYSMYVVSDFQSSDLMNLYQEEEISEILQKISLPVLLAGITTAIGFSSLYLSDLGAIREFGLFSVIGIIYATVFSLTLTPSLLVLSQRWARNPVRIQSVHETGLFDRVIERIAHFDAEHRTAIYFIAGAVAVIGLAGMYHLRVGTEHITNFPPDSEIRRAFEHANEKLNGINPFSIVVQSQYPEAFKEPASLRAIEELQQWLDKQPEVGGSTSLVDYIKFVNRAFHDNDPDHDTIPDSKKVISQLLFFTENEDTERLVDKSHKVLNIIVRANVIDSDDVKALITRVEERLMRLPGHLSARATGNPVLVNNALDNIMWGQIESVFLTLVIVYCVLVGLFLSFKVGLVAIIPNILPVVVYFGTLGITGISLNPSTSLIAPMIIGVAIDDTVHYFARFNSIARQYPDPTQATVRTLGVVARPVTFTSLALCIGFLVLTTSDLRMQVQVGALASFSLLVAWLSDLFVTPALCSRLRIATLWDVVTLDLGKRPQDTMPLFHGLSNFQARIVARMATIKKFSAGERIIEKGQKGEEMYTVIDGSLQASIEGDHGRVNLDKLERGDTFGEAGLFYATRTADVDVVEDARVISITRENLRVLQKRYPRVAAQLGFNLNRILSTRLANTTSRLK